MSKKLTERYMQAIFHRGKAEYLPLEYLTDEVRRMAAPGEDERVEDMLARMQELGYVEKTDQGYKLVREVE